MAAASLWVQLFLALGWTVYVIYLPQLAAQAGLPKESVPWLLLADQAIFAAMDWTLGTMADRMADWASENFRLTSEADLDRYTMGVAGAVGLEIFPDCKTCADRGARTHS